jgi:tetratricopeptide (TPR) repeat protein
MLLRLLLISIFASMLVYGQNTNQMMMKLSLAESYERAGDLANAAKIYEELYQLEPKNNLYFESLNRVFIALKNYAASINLIETEINNRPNDINLYGLLGSTYYLHGNEKKAYEMWDKPFVFLEPNPVFYRVIANYAVQRRAFEKAIDVYSKGKEIAEDKTIFSYDLALLYSITMQFEKAAEEYCFILVHNPTQLETVETKLVATTNNPNAIKPAIRVVEKYANEDNISVIYLLARLYIENQDFEKAYELYLELDKNQNKQGMELYGYADFLYRENEYKLSGQVYEKVIELYPNTQLIPSAKLGYAKSMEAILMEEYSNELPLWKPYFALEPFESGDVEVVIEAFTEVAELYNHTEAAYEAILRIGVLKFYLQNKQEEAKDYFNKIINEATLSQSTAYAYTELGEIALLNGNLTEAERNFTQITVLAKASVNQANDAKYNLARIKLYLGELAQAKELLAEVTKDLKDNNANDALEFSLILNAAKFDSASLVIFAEGEFLADQKKFGEATQKYALIANNQQAFILHSLATIRMAEMELAQDNYTQAIQLFDAVVEEGEKNIYADKALYLLGKIYQYGMGDNTKAVEIYEKLLAKFPASIYLDEARSEIIKLREKVI